MTNKDVEVTRVSSLGIWLKARGKKFFLSYYDFPSFKDKPVRAVLNVQQPVLGQFYWPEMELWIAMTAIEDAAQPRHAFRQVSS